MKKLFILLFTALIFASCGKDAKEVKVNVENGCDFDRTTELVEIPIEKVKEKITLADNQAYIVKNEKGEVIPSQVTYDGQLLFESGLKAKQSANFTITAGESQEYTPKTYGRFVTERKDDFAWENDRVAFRIYGPALVEVDGPSNGIDLWYKCTSNLVLDKWYKDDIGGVASYHEDHGEGLDDYKVGRTLGAGAMAPYVSEKLWLNENFTTQEVLDNGPLRTTFKLTYKDMNVDDKTFSESRTFSIDAGSQLTKITQEYGTAETIPVAAGLVKRQEGDSVIVAPDKTYIEYLEPKTNKTEGVYLALVFPQGFDSTTVDTYKIINDKSKKEDSYSHLLAIVSYKPNTPITYYTGYGWNKFGFPGEADFEEYLKDFVTAQKEPLKVIIE